MVVRGPSWITIYFVMNAQQDPLQTGTAPLPAKHQPPGWRAYLASAGLVGLATVVGLPLRPFINPTNLVMLYFVAVIVAAIWLGSLPAVFASLLSLVIFDLVFVSPYYTLAIDDAQYLLTFAGLLVVSLVISTLTARAREQEQAARSREAQAVALYEFSQKLAASASLPDIAQTAVLQVQKTLAYPAALFLIAGRQEAGDSSAQPLLLAATPGLELTADTYTAAGRVGDQGQPPSPEAVPPHPVAGYFLPLQTLGQTLGVLFIASVAGDTALTADQTRFLASFASQVAQALERARLEETARQARLLEETEKLQTALLNSISHDLRTPLASITGALSSLLEDAPLLSEEARKELILTAWEEAIRLNRLVGNLLDMTRLQSGALRVVRQTNDVEDLVGATLAQMPRRLRGRVVQTTIPPDLPPVEIDLALVVQVLVNLLDNALKFAPVDQPINIEAVVDGEWVILTVKDRGPGLPEGSSELLFHKFFRGPGDLAAGRWEVGGTGLGLSIAKGIVEAHGGRIWADNRPGGGAVFSFSLPAAMAEPGEPNVG